MRKRSVYLWLFVTVFALVLAGCTQPTATQPDAAPPAVQPTVTPDVTPDVTPEVADVRVIEIDAENLEFSPDNIDVDLGETVRFVLNSIDGDHTFTVKRNIGDVEPLFALEVPAAASEEVVWTFDENGEYHFYCEYHEDLGMWGTITVRD